jgi:hypothetical protein
MQKAMPCEVAINSTSGLSAFSEKPPPDGRAELTLNYEGSRTFEVETSARTLFKISLTIVAIHCQELMEN